MKVGHRPTLLQMEMEYAFNSNKNCRFKKMAARLSKTANARENMQIENSNYIHKRMNKIRRLSSNRLRMGFDFRMRNEFMALQIMSVY